MLKKFQFYNHLYSERNEILTDAKQFGAGLEIKENLRGRIGLTGSHSSFPGPIAKDVMGEITRAQEVRESLPRSNPLTAPKRHRVITDRAEFSVAHQMPKGHVPQDTTN